MVEKTSKQLLSYAELSNVERGTKKQFGILKGAYPPSYWTPSQPSSMPARGPGSTWTPTGTTSALPAMAALPAAAYSTTLATVTRGQTLAGRARGISSIALIKTTGAASGTPLKNLRTMKRSQSPSTGPEEPVPRRVQQQKNIST